MFKKVVLSGLLSMLLALPVNVIAGAESEYWEAPLKHMGNFTGPKKCWDLCKKINKYDDMCKKDIGKTLHEFILEETEGKAQHIKAYMDTNYGRGEEIHNLILTRANLTIVYILRCFGVHCDGLFEIGTEAEVIKREFLNRDMTPYANLPDNNGCREGGPVPNFLAKELEDMNARDREGISPSEGYAN